MVRASTVFGEYLRATRIRRGLTQGQLADMLGMEQSAVSKWERGTLKVPSPEKIRAFADALDDPIECMALAAVGLWPGDPMAAAEAQEISPALARLLAMHPTADEAELLAKMLEQLRDWLDATVRGRA